jgi:FkbM family methyltransferase
MTGLPTIKDIDTRELVAAPQHRAMFDRQVSSREPHERDFFAFALFNNPNSIVFDVGANIGNSALSFHTVQPTWRVISFEPNAALAPYLREVAQIFERNNAMYEVHQVGLGSRSETKDFYVPRIENWHVVGEASFDLEHFRHPIVAARIAGYSKDRAWSLSRSTFPIVGFDKYAPMQALFRTLKGAESLFVKMDVEGFELEAIAGMEFFLRTYRPIMMVENDPMDRVPERLAEFGYSAFRYDVHAKKLVRLQSRAGLLNLFYLPQDFIASKVLSHSIVA